VRTLFILALLVALSASTSAEPVWEVQRNGKKIYVIGSVHAAKPSRPPLSSFIKKLISDADLVYFEIDPKGSAMAAPRPTPSASTLAASQYADLAAAAISESSMYLKYCFGNDLSSIASFEPWRWIIECDVLWSLRSGMDVRFGTESLAMRQLPEAKPILTAGLEDLNSLVGLLGGIPPDHWLHFFRENMRNRDPIEIIKGIEDQVSETLFPSEESIESSIHESWYSTAEKRAISAWMIDHRNIEFFSKMNRALSSKTMTVFFVGNSHTLGPSGVVSQFRALGDVNVRFISNEKQVVEADR
jgi:uncharacterized protein YbaP (TraB family)